MADGRKTKTENGEHEDNKLSEKAEKQIQELLGEKNLIDKSRHPHVLRLLDQEIDKVKTSGRPSPKEFKISDIYNQRPIKVSIKVLVPVREHPKFNFVGKLLGPKGNTMKRLQDETMCKMAILGRGSMKDRDKEDELRTQGDPKFAHLADDLHVEITAFGPPAEAHARIAFALAEVRKYLIPDNNDDIRQEQMRQIGHVGDYGGPPPPHMRGAPPLMKPFNPNKAGLLDSPGAGRGPRPGPYHSGPPVSMRTATREPVHHGSPGRSIAKPSKVMSILDKARMAMKEPYGSPTYEEEYEPPYEYYPPVVQSSGYSKPTSSSYYEPAYEEEEYYSPREKRSSREYGVLSSSDAWKTKTSTRSSESRHRSAPYARPRK